MVLSKVLSFITDFVTGQSKKVFFLISKYAFVTTLLYMTLVIIEYLNTTVFRAGGGGGGQIEIMIFFLSFFYKI